MIEFFFDCSSPWTYLAFHNIGPLAREFDEAIVWRPILVGGIFNTINPSVYQSREKARCGQGPLRQEGPGGLGKHGRTQDRSTDDLSGQ